MIRLHLLFIASSQYIIYIEHGKNIPLKFYTFIGFIGVTAVTMATS